MAEQIIQMILEWLLIYFLIGLIFSCLFLSFGITRVDPSTKGAGLAFRLLILPGLLVFWPLFVFRWLTGRRK